MRRSATPRQSNEQICKGPASKGPAKPRQSNDGAAKALHGEATELHRIERNCSGKARKGKERLRQSYEWRGNGKAPMRSAEAIRSVEQQGR